MKKIVIRVPDLLLAGICHFHFIVRLRQHFPEAEINLLVPAALLPFYRHFVVFLLRLHPIPAEIRSWRQIYRYAVNLPEIFNIDSYFDLENDHRSAFLGWCLRARNRLGIRKGLSSWPVNRPLRPYQHSLEIHTQLGHPIVADDFEALVVNEYQKNSTFQSYLQSGLQSGQIPMVMDDLVYRRYFLVFLGEIQSTTLQEFWKNFLGQFSQQYFIFYRGSSETNIIAFMQQLDKKNEYRVLLDDEGTKLSNFAIKAQAIIGTEAWQGALASYFGCRSFILDFHHVGAELLASLPFSRLPEIIQLRAGGYWLGNEPAEGVDEAGLAEAILRRVGG